MIQDINTTFDQQFSNRLIQPGDYYLMYKGRNVFIKDGELPTYKEGNIENFHYLFRIGNSYYYLCLLEEDKDYEPLVINDFTYSNEVSFAIMTGYHIYKWINNHKYCGRCGHKLIKHQSMQALECTDCGHVIFPDIFPAVIIAVVHDEKLLMVKHNKDPKFPYALIAGFCEFGETVEDTVRREVKEEVGLTVTDMKYFDSQPWGVVSNLLMGYIVHVKDSNISIDKEEIYKARWFNKDEIPDDLSEASLTGTLVQYIKRRK